MQTASCGRRCYSGLSRACVRGAAVQVCDCASMPASPSITPHSFLLDVASRSRGISVAAEVGQLVGHLDRGLPLRIGILGASVAEQAGCLNQDGKECQHYDGIHNATPGWGKPAHRPFAGWLIRFFHWMNITWPHAGHTVYNGAQSARPLHAALGCLDLYAPPDLDLVFLEPLSAGVNSPNMEKLVRHLLERRPQPTLVFVNVPLWYANDIVVSDSQFAPMIEKACGVNRHNHATTSSRNATAAKHLPRGAATGFRSLERHVMQLCRRYSQTCLSMCEARGPALFLCLAPITRLTPPCLSAHGCSPS